MTESTGAIGDAERWIAHQTWPDARFMIETAEVSGFVHPYGFTVVRAESVLDGWQARVHFWTPQVRGPVDNFSVHSHGWHLASLVLIGSVVEKRYLVVEDEDGGWERFQVESTVNEGESLLRADGRTFGLNLKDMARRTSETGVYSIARDTFHSTGTDSFAVTLCITSTASSGESFVLAPRSRTGETQVAAFRRAAVENLSELVARADEMYLARIPKEDQWASFVFILDANDRIAMARTARNPGYWMPIGGRAKSSDSDPLETVIREVQEEVGLEVRGDRLVPLGEYSRDIGVGVTYFWRMRLRDTELLIPSMEEFDEFEWMSQGEILRRNIFSGTRNVLLSRVAL
ncbi:NUDIX hydrolase [Tsukamurella hominis]|uniref:NUDIX hydrolase n=1 Tax=Tsukamurella hominis TaxID=1970232 RepID=UPI0039EB42DB